jgi:hypothetical protein
MISWVGNVEWRNLMEIVGQPSAEPPFSLLWAGAPVGLLSFDRSFFRPPNLGHPFYAIGPRLPQYKSASLLRMHRMDAALSRRLRSGPLADPRTGKCLLEKDGIRVFVQSIEGIGVQLLMRVGGETHAFLSDMPLPIYRRTAERVLRCFALAEGLPLLQGCHLHASAASRSGKTLLFCGDKFAGKTTSLLEMLRNGWDFTSNDEVMLCPDGRVFGVPISIGVRAGTRKALKELAMVGDRAAGLEGQTITMGIADICGAFRSNIKPSGQCAVICFLKSADGDEEFNVRRIDYTEAQKLLLSTVLAQISKHQEFWNYGSSNYRCADILHNISKPYTDDVIFLEAVNSPGRLADCARFAASLVN